MSYIGRLSLSCIILKNGQTYFKMLNIFFKILNIYDLQGNKYTKITLNLFMHKDEKWPNILLKSCTVNTSRFLKYVWSFFNIMHESAKEGSIRTRVSHQQIIPFW